MKNYLLALLTLLGIVAPALAQNRGSDEKAIREVIANIGVSPWN